MKRILDLTAQVFGRWTVLRRLPDRTRSKAVWFCRCVCGKEKEVLSYSLTSGESVSCGCLRIELLVENNISRTLPSGEASFNYMYNQYRGGADKRQLEFSLSKEQFAIMTKQPCEYCGALPLQRLYDFGSTPYLCNGVDRADSSKGYTKENCVPCCTLCNLAKRDLTKEEFQNWIDRLVKFQILKETVNSVGKR